MKWLARTLALLSLVTLTSAQEKLVLTNPAPNITEYRLTELRLSWGRAADDCLIMVQLTPNVEGGVEIRHVYRGATACTLLKQINTANLATKSLQRRLMEQVVTDNVLVGTPTGTPEK